MGSGLPKETGLLPGVQGLTRRMYSLEGMMQDPFAGRKRAAQDMAALHAFCAGRADLRDLAPSLAPPAASPGAQQQHPEQADAIMDPDEAVGAILERCGDLLGLTDAQVQGLSAARHRHRDMDTGTICTGITCSSIGLTLHRFV